MYKDFDVNLFVRDLTVIDSSYLSQTRGMVGESWILDISLSGDLDEMSMVLDFGQVKKQVKKLVDEVVDHKLLVPMRNKHMFIEKANLGYSTVDLVSKNNTIHLYCPDEAICLIDTESINQDSVTEYLHNVLKTHLPENVKGIELTLRTENIDGAYYHYSHGLKKHDGNCQRIAHGHRSPIELFVDGIRDPQLEQKFANRWKDIYLGSKEDLVTLGTLSLSKHALQTTEESHFAFKYTAPQGEFQLAIEKKRTELIETDTTIELLANFIADEVKSELSDTQTVRVVAYEGVGKGAIAVR